MHRRVLLGLGLGLGLGVLVVCLAAWDGGSTEALRPSCDSTENCAAGREAPLSARLALPSKKMMMGSTMRGAVIVTNHTGEPIEGIGCGAPFSVALRNEKVSQEVSWFMCREEIVLPVGRSRYPVTAVATYLLCSQRAPTRDATKSDGPHRWPACIDGRAPGLPPGRYEATVVEFPGYPKISVSGPTGILVTDD